MKTSEKIIINVGRQFGSGGKQVALELGKRLDISVYDNELISKAAEASGFSKDFFKEKDEKRNLFSFSSFFSTQLGQPQNYVNENELFKIQSSVIRDIAEKESAVIVGRCADYILRDKDFTLDIFITAPLEARKERVAQRLGLSLEKAEETIARTDRKRETYYNYFTFGHWGVASNYDLCVDSSILGIDGTADYIIDFARRAGLMK
ncbi:MAG: cytidylate kinase-like family protein [Bacteroidetes bacterium]|uniref:Cytidylate kinase-like family protein n=1 Tax=Candidatus Cryptobacteroides intestinigallinarum TaxID=2840767 RepID=A0A9D9HLB3_9BACT|nr:cytidylate kinase-like family protein [Candidatus Cryptobacteroides intestinigallinarum]